MSWLLAIAGFAMLVVLHEAGHFTAAKLVGTESDRIVTEISALLDDKAAYEAMARAHNPFGDGTAARQIVEILGNEIRDQA